MYPWNGNLPAHHTFETVSFSLQLSKEDTEEYIEYLKSIGWLDEAAKRLADVINDDGFVSKEGKSKHQVT